MMSYPICESYNRFDDNNLYNRFDDVNASLRYSRPIGTRSARMVMERFDEMGQTQRNRLAFIEFRLWFLGSVSRKDLMARFGIAPAVATRDLTAYRELAAGNIDFDGSRKIYVIGSEFAPIFEHSSERVLSAISRGFGDGADQREGSYLPCELPLRLNRPSMDILATVTRAIHQKQVLRVRYHSLKRGTSDQLIAPHALVDSGLRWHARVFDRSKSEFRDLVISRIESASTIFDSEVLAEEAASQDEQWNRVLTLDLIPHPRQKRPEIVARDFGMTGAALTVRIRAAVAGYVLQLWNVDCSADRVLDPRIHRLCMMDPTQLAGVTSAEIAPGFTGNAA